MRSKTLLLTLCLLLAVCAAAQDLTVKQIMAEPSLAGTRADSESLSPDGTKVLYQWSADPKEMKSLYLWDGAGDPRVLLKQADFGPAFRPQFPESKLNYGVNLRDGAGRGAGVVSGVAWSPDSKKILFTQSGDLWTLDMTTAGAKPNRLTKTQSPEFFARWIDNRRIMMMQAGNIFVLDTAGFSLVQISRESNPAQNIGVQNPSASEDGSMIAYTVADSSKFRTLYVPAYIGEFVEANSTRRGFSEQKVMAAKSDGSADRVMEIKLPKPEGVGYVRSLKWAADNRSLIVDRIDKDLKRRQLFYVYHVGGKDEKIVTVTEETDDKWVAGLSRMIEPNPKDASQVLFTSERDGYNHIYLANLERAASPPNPSGEVRQENTSDAGYTGKSNVTQLTRGNFEVDWVKWNAGGTTAFYSSTEDGAEIREFYSIKPGQPRIRFLTGDKGMKGGAEIDRVSDSPRILYGMSTWNSPEELYVAHLCSPCHNLPQPAKITSTTPESFKKMTWNAPKFIDIPTRDNKVVKAKIYLPAGHNSANAKKYPMAIFVHGAGYLQNTINGWNNYYREFMFNQILTRKGYVVLDLDYRGSAGYGRDWRTDVHDFLGGLDYEDHIDGIDYMVKNYGVDQKKIGAYGGSYGGFMAEMLAMRAPDRIAAAAALRPVGDWKNYFASSPVYTVERLGFPDKNPEAYKRSSPIAYAEKLERPLLILHGLVDDNVPAQDSIQLVEKLIRLGKTPYFELMLYPSESHAFTRPESWTDEYERILTFFEKHLK